jgi:hypothetical protein
MDISFQQTVETGPIIEQYHEMIIPKSNWTDWNEKSQVIHRITREELFEKGVPVEKVRADLKELLDRTEIMSDAPSYDEFWLNRIYEDSSVDISVDLFDPMFLSFANGVKDNSYLEAYMDKVEAYGKAKSHGALNDARDLAQLVKDCFNSLNT